MFMVLLFCQLQHNCDGVYGRMHGVEAPHICLRSSLCCSASSCTTSSAEVTSSTSSPVCTAARNMKVNETWSRYSYMSYGCLLFVFATTKWWCTWKNTCVEAPHICWRSSLCCSASSCLTSSVTSSTSSPVCTAARNMKVNETWSRFIYELWLLTICVSNNQVMVYMEEYMCESTTHAYVRVWVAPHRAAQRHQWHHRHRRRYVRRLETWKWMKQYYITDIVLIHHIRTFKLNARHRHRVYMHCSTCNLCIFDMIMNWGCCIDMESRSFFCG